jgi:pyruvate/2-oxoglutarate/acetoin dehydrogenase E1 component
MVTFAEALVEALYDAMAEDERVVLVASLLFGMRPSHKLLGRIYERFADRVIEPPNCEAAVAGLGIGAALTGQRPVVNMMVSNFAYLAWSQIVNEAGNLHYMTNGQSRVPLVFYAMHGVRGGGGVQHSASPQAMLWNCPGLELVLPATPADAKGLFGTALRSDNPTIFLVHPKMFDIEGEVDTRPYCTPFGRAAVHRPGSDLTILATSWSVQQSLRAADTLQQQGVSAEVVDPRSLTPLDEDGLAASVEKTGRLLIVDECAMRCGVAAELSTAMTTRCFGSLKAAPQRVTRADTPIAYSKPLEAAVIPDEQAIVDAALRLVRV